MKKEKLGEIFVNAGLISAKDRDHVLTENQAHSDEKLGQTLVRLGLASDTEVARALSFQLDIPFIDLPNVVIDPRAIQKIPVELAKSEHILPVFLDKNDLILAMEDPQDFDAIEQARFASGLTIRPHLAAASEIDAGIARHYAIDESVGAILQNVTPDNDVQLFFKQITPTDQQLQDLEKQSESPAIVKMVNTIIFQGIAVRADAIRIEPRKRDVLVQNRVDGVLVESMKIPKWTQGALLSRVKILGGLDIGQRHSPQQGRTTIKMQQRVIDIDISSYPTQSGECLIIHLLDTGETIPLLEDLGFLPDDLKKITAWLQLPQGMILVCGPRGSGKTTTLYTLAHELAGQQRKIITLKESIEYRLQGAHQVQIDETAGLTFTKALQSVLRHQPDVILIGETRDKDTAEMAMNASLQKHLILSALRTDDIMATLIRLKDLGADSELLAASLSGMISQRLVRKICERCREPYSPSSTLLEKIEALSGETMSGDFSRGKGCEACNYTGYHGRIGVYHVVTMSKGFREFIKDAALDGKMPGTILRRETTALLKNILEKIRHGITTVEELERVLFNAGQADMTRGLTCEVCQQPLESGSRVCTSCAQARPSSLPDGVEQILEPAQIAPARNSADSDYAFKEMKILLVDDDNDLVQRLRLILQEKSFTVTTAANGEEALEKIARDKPHLVITDVTMPKMDGLELVRRLRKNITTAFIPVIMLSAKNRTADRLKGFAVGTDDYLPKPFSIHELFFRVNAVLRRVYK